MNSYFDFPSEAVAAQPVSPVKMEDVDATYSHETNHFMNVQPVSPVKLEEDLEHLSYTDSWHSVPIKMEDIEEEEYRQDIPIKDEHVDPLPFYHLPANLMDDNVADTLPNVMDTLQANDLQKQLDEAYQEIERLKNEQQQNRSMIRQLADGVLHEQGNREWYIQQALEEERANQQQVVNDILFSSHQGAEFFPEQLVLADGSIANFLLMEKLGQGGFGCIHRSVRVNEHGQHVPCALKIVDADNEDIRHEAEVLRQLNHENIIQCYGTILDEPNRQLGILLELGATDVSDRHEDHGISALDLREISIGVLKALRYLHSQGICHMDIKPDNIMIMSEVECPLQACDVKLCDFGLAISSSTMRTGYMGTRDYMDPEMVGATPYNTEMADMWSFGATLMELLLGFTDDWTEAYEVFDDANDPYGKNFRDGLQYCIDSLGDYYERLMTPSERPCLELIKQLLRLNPKERLSAKQALAVNSYWLGVH